MAICARAVATALKSGRATPHSPLASCAAKASTTLRTGSKPQPKRLIARVVLPGEWYLVRWGGTRKGSGSFYTRPGLAVPTVQRTLRPLAFDPPEGTDRDAPPQQWIPKPPEDILALKVCDPPAAPAPSP